MEEEEEEDAFDEGSCQLVVVRRVCFYPRCIIYSDYIYRGCLRIN